MSFLFKFGAPQPCLDRPVSLAVGGLCAELFQDRLGEAHGKQRGGQERGGAGGEGVDPLIIYLPRVAPLPNDGPRDVINS